MSVTVKGLSKLKDVIIKNIPGYVPVEPSTPLSTNLAGHTMSKLNDGRFLITGGTTTAANSGITANTWIGTASGSSISWTASTALPVALKWHTVSILTDGRILVIGGTTNGTAAVATTYIGTITGNVIAWVAGTALGAIRMKHAAVKLTDGRVLIAGGVVAGAISNSTVFATVTGDTIAYVAGTNMYTAISAHSIVEVVAGRIFSTGGTRSGTVAENLNYTGAISGNTITWNVSGVLPISVQQHTATVIDNNRIVVVGGFNGTTSVSNVYYGIWYASNPTSITWAQGNSITAARSQHATVVLGTNKIVTTSGIDTTSTPTNTTYIINTLPAVSWTASTGTLPKTVTNSTIWRDFAAADDERVSFITGTINGVISAETYVGSIIGDTTLTWAQYANTLGIRRDAAKTNGDTLTFGRVAIIGGTTNGSNAANTVYIGTPNYSAGTMGWFNSTALPGGVNKSSTMNVLPDGRMLLLGGSNDNNLNTTPNTYFGTIGLGSNVVSWAAGTAMPNGKRQHASTVLKDGRILTVGGVNTSNTLTNVCYIGTIGGALSNTITWVTTTAAPLPISGHSVVTLDDGRVAVVGGNEGGYSGKIYIGTVTGDTITWKLDIAGMPETRSTHETTVLDDGRILVIGGTNGTASNNIWFGTVNY